MQELSKPIDQDFEAPDNERRFGGLARLYGAAGAQAIRQSHVVVVGIGGVGSWAAEALARSGVAEITLIDMDHVAESNVNRQIHALNSTIGQSKADAMRERIAQIHPGCIVHCIEEFVTPDNWLALLPPRANAVVDACDQIHAKTAMAAWARRSKSVVFVGVGAAGGKCLAHAVEYGDLASVTHDPLLAQMRNRLRKHHGAPAQGKKIGANYIFSREPVSPPPVEACDIISASDGSLNCHGYGSVVSVTAVFGMAAAGEILNNLAKFGFGAKNLI